MILKEPVDKFIMPYKSQNIQDSKQLRSDGEAKEGDAPNSKISLRKRAISGVQNSVDSQISLAQLAFTSPTPLSYHPVYATACKFPKNSTLNFQMFS